jgi:hypothetical protein
MLYKELQIRDVMLDIGDIVLLSDLGLPRQGSGHIERLAYATKQ